jgi:uncharacterized protein YndB with AHSA1/START domain
MSKKKKGSSAKTKKKTATKSPKKKTSKPAAKKKSVKAATKKKPLKKIAAKKTKPAKKIVSKKVKVAKPAKVVASSKNQKTIVKGSIKEYHKPNQEIKNPALLKKDSSPIPEFKPIIQPTSKNDSDKSKEAFSTLKNTNSASFVSTPIKKADSYSIKPEKEPAGKFEIEIVIRASAGILYEFLVTPSGLSEWFCDDVNIRNGIYTFIWDGQLQQARLLKTVEEQLVRYQWVDKTDGSFFEFKIQRDDLTNDISLIITDFATDKVEQESSKLLWQSQIDKLLHVMGSYF